MHESTNTPNEKNRFTCSLQFQHSQCFSSCNDIKIKTCISSADTSSYHYTWNQPSLSAIVTVHSNLLYKDKFLMQPFQVIYEEDCIFALCIFLTIYEENLIFHGILGSMFNRWFWNVWCFSWVQLLGMCEWFKCIKEML